MSAGRANDVASGGANGGKLTCRITKTFQGTGRRFGLDVDFSASAGISILFGPSGAGKTTLLDCIAGLTSPDSGSITIGGKSLFDQAAAVDIPVPERRVGYVFQDLALFPHLNVEKNVGYGLRHFARAERQDRVAAILQSFGVGHLARRKSAEVSGGEAQTAALARTLVTDPQVLLLDEPLAGLDAPTKSKILDDLRVWNTEHAIPILYVTHSRDEVFALGEHVFMLESGRIVAQGTPHEVMSAPRQETVAQLARFENVFDAVVVAVHENRGTMTCLLEGSTIEIETPLVRAPVGSNLRIGIRAGDILLATLEPRGLSARNILSGTVTSVVQRDMIVEVKVDCGVEAEAHLTLAARDSLHLGPGHPVWLIVKTHSCHLMAK